ncbi:MAG: glycosyltransferase [Pseudomonadota bacterium]
MTADSEDILREDQSLARITVLWDDGSGFDAARALSHNFTPGAEVQSAVFTLPGGARAVRLELSGPVGTTEILDLQLSTADGALLWLLDPADEDCRRALLEAAATAGPDQIAPILDEGRVVFATASTAATWDVPLSAGPQPSLRDGALVELAWRVLDDPALWHAQARRLGQARGGLIEASAMAGQLARAQLDSAELKRIHQSRSWRILGLVNKVLRFARNPALILTRVRQYGGWKMVARLAAKKLGLRRLITRPPSPPAAAPVAGVTTPPSDWQMARYGDYMARRDPELMAMTAEGCADQPLISICVPVYNPEPEGFRELIDSVIAQTYPNWELCLADDCSPDPAVRPLLEALATQEPRIKLVFRPENGHIAEATNSAIALAKGAYIGFTDQDDRLHPACLAQVVRALNESPEAALIYTDEDKLVAGQRTFPYFKPDWSPTLFQAQDFINHLTLIKADLVAEVGGLRKAYNGCQDFDLLFRCIERIRPEQILHIPEVLYHWRVTEGSIAGDPNAKRYAFDNARGALAEHLERSGQPGQATEAFHFSLHRVITPRPRDISVSICLFSPTPDQLDLAPWRAWAEARPDLSLEVLLVPTGQQAASRNDVAVLPGQADWSEGTRFRAALDALRGDLAIVLDASLGAPTGEALDEWIAQAWRPEIGAAGPRVLDPDGRVVHAGAIVAPDGLRLPYFGHDKSDHGRFQHLQLPHEVAAVAPYALAIKRSLLHETPEMTSATGCALTLQIAARKAGKYNLWTPHVTLTCPAEPLRTLFGRGLPGRDRDRLRGDLVDPTYSPKLRLDRLFDVAVDGGEGGRHG